MTEQKPLSVDCPNCGASVGWTAANSYRPFCSRRCKDADFIDWAEESQRIAGSASYDDLFSEGNLDAD
ncbi:MAG: DNA gyrase inhibitor YacG [Pseudomonadales bacterium]